MSGLAILDALRHHAEERGDAIAYREARGAVGRSITFGELLEQSAAVAARIRRHAPPGSVVLITLPNQLEMPASILGTWLAECVAFPMPADSGLLERKAAAAQSGAAIVIDGSIGVTGEKIADDKLTIGMTFAGGAPRGDYSIVDASSGEGRSFSRAATRRPEAALLLKSSGTTGRPQIVRRSAAAIDAVCDQMMRAMEIQSADRVLAIAPLSHSYGIEHGLLMPLTAGAAVHLCPGFDLPTVMRELNESAITFLPGVPAVYEMLVKLTPGGTRWPSLRRAYSAGAALPREVFERARERFDLTIEQLYGATEIGSVTFGDRHAAAFDARSVGVPMNGVEAKISSIEDGRVQSAGVEGELWVRAKSMFDGYLDPAASVRIENGFFATGDLASIDPAGQITITGRLSLLIDVGGLKVNPIEVEEVIARHEQVASCVVLPVRQTQTVCRIRALVTPRDPAHPPAIDSLRRWAKEHLAAHKVPRSFEIRPTLPRTATGKILRHKVDA